MESKNREHSADDAAGLDNGDHRRQDTPGCDIVSGRARNGQAAQRCLGQAALMQDPSQHRKRSDAHGDAHEQAKGQKGDMGRGKPRIQEVSQADPHRKGDNNAGVADDDGRVSPMLQQLDVQFHADDEHEQNQAQLAEKV